MKRVSKLFICLVSGKRLSLAETLDLSKFLCEDRSNKYEALLYRGDLFLFNLQTSD